MMHLPFMSCCNFIFKLAQLTQPSLPKSLTLIARKGKNTAINGVSEYANRIHEQDLFLSSASALPRQFIALFASCNSALSPKSSCDN